ncbi:MAG: hypothetical protein U0269_02110 [Polyangiales bacterium]
MVVAASLALAIASRGERANAQGVPIVYVRCARTTATVEVSGMVTVGGVSRMATRTMRGLDVYDVFPDVTHFFSGFSAPCDLVYRAADGNERVLHDCSSSSTDASACAAMDPAVSFDGRTVAYAVFRGTITHPSENVLASVIDPAAENRDQYATRYPNRILQATEAQLHLVDVATGRVTALPHTRGTFDSGPAWLPSGRITFTSSRDGASSTQVPGSTSSGRASQLWTMDIDGRNAEIASHHGLGREEHPLVLKDGRVAYSSWQVFGALPFRYGNGTVGGFNTLDNMFNLYVQDPDGAHPFALYGQHSGDHTPTTSIGVGHTAAHFIAQTTDGRVWTTDYYRANNNGLGALVGFVAPDEGQEGIAPGPMVPVGDWYAPRTMVNAGRWSNNSDQMAIPMPVPAYSVPTYRDPLPFAGKLGHPAALPGNRLMAVWGKGACSIVSGNEVFRALGRAAPAATSGSGAGTAMNVITSLGLDTPGCDAGIYLFSRIPSMHPSDLQLIVDRPEWHEIQARAVVPYMEIFGVERPVERRPNALTTRRAELQPAQPFGLLGAASIIDRETAPAGGIHFAGEHQFQLQGTDTIRYNDSDLCGVRILGVQPNRGDVNVVYREINDLSGEKVVILGEFAVRNYDAMGRPRMDPSGMVDTSFLARIPANVPYLMQAIDCDGRTLNTDQTWQHVRPGEMKTCGGCHVHSRPSRSSFEQSWAAGAEYRPARLGEGTVPLLTGSTGAAVNTRSVPGYALQIEFERDVLPIFNARCASCHSGATPAGNLALDRAGIAGPTMSAPASTWWCLVRDRSQSCVPPAQRFVSNAGSMGSTALRRPQATRYIRAFNALGSLLYWKAAGRRTDGNMDSTFTSASPADDRDIDFGPAHPTTITPEELGLLSRWIDIGSPGGAGALRDTTKPTLTMAGVVDGASVTALRVGTIDVPSGIDPASLEVCVVEGDAGCGPNLATMAAMHDAVEIRLSAPLTNPETEVRARVRDRAGNETVLQKTVRWLLGMSPPAIALPDASSDADASASADGSTTPTNDAGSMTGADSQPPASSGCGCSVPASGGGTTRGWLVSCVVALALVARRRAR